MPLASAPTFDVRALFSEIILRAYHAGLMEHASREVSTGGAQPCYLSLGCAPPAHFHAQLLFISASVRSSDSTENSPNPVASDRASIRSTLLFTTPVSVTRPFSTMMWIGGFAIAA